MEPSEAKRKRFSRLSEEEIQNLIEIELARTADLQVAGWLGGAGDPGSILLYYWYVF